MKLYTIDNSELMDISTITAEGGNLVVEGTIMGAVPVRAVVKPAEMRAAMRQMSMATKMKAAAMLFRGSR